MPKIDTTGLALPFLKGKTPKLEKAGKKGMIASVVGEGGTSEFRGKERVFVLIEMDGESYKWTPAGLALSRLVDAWGDDTKKWVGKKATLYSRPIVDGPLKGNVAIDAYPK